MGLTLIEVRAGRDITPATVPALVAEVCRLQAQLATARREERERCASLAEPHGWIGADIARDIHKMED